MQLNPLALALSTAGGSRWTPLNLFFGGIQGLWYDLNDDATIFQDSAGTTLASWGDPVGRVNDKSGNGNNAIQSTAGSRPIRGRMPKRGRVNLLAATQRFDDAYWTKSLATITANSHIAPDGTMTADTITATGAFAAATRTLTVVAGVAHAESIYVLKTTGAITYYPLYYFVLGGGQATGIFLDTTTGAVTDLTGAGNIAPTSKTSVDAGLYWRISFTFNTTNASVQVHFYPAASTNGSTAASIIAGSQVIWGIQLEQSATATAYQHVIDSLGFNVTESGQPSCGYLSYNGSNQWMQTAASVNFSATDEMSVFAGVLKRAASGIFGTVVELSATASSTAGSFAVFAPGQLTASPSEDYSFLLYGSQATGFDAITFTAPIYNVLSSNFNISEATRALAVRPRVNGAVPTLIAGLAASAGTGNFGNHIAYFGARAGSSVFFNGLMFSTIIRGALTSGTLLTRTEQYVARQTPTVNL